MAEQPRPAPTTQPATGTVGLAPSNLTVGGVNLATQVNSCNVVIRTADERRLIVPTAKFLDTTFQNWTRVAGGITGSVVLPIVAGQAIGPIRAAFERLLAECPEWDKRTAALQVSEVKADAIELKLVMSARDPGEMARLRFAVREAMVEWLRLEMPEALKKG